MLKRHNLYLALLLALIISGVTFAQSEKRVAYGVLIDNTGSLRSQFDYVKVLGKGVIERIHPQGSISLFSFRTEGTTWENSRAVVDSGVEWSQDRATLGSYIEGLWIIPGQTTLYDAIYSIAENINAKVNLNNDAFTDKVIILISDGEDRHSKIKEKQLIEKLKESSIKFYAIGLTKELEKDGGFINKSLSKATGFLKKAAKETGGRVVFTKSNKVDVNTLLNELFTESGRK